MVANDFAKLVENLSPTASGKTICVFGHAVFLNATAALFASAFELPAPLFSDLEKIDLGEAEGLWLQKLPDGSTILRHLHSRALAPAHLSADPLAHDY